MAELVASPVAIDLSRLPAPAVVVVLSYEDELAALNAEFAARCAAAGIAYDAFLESDPAQALLETAAYRIFLSKGQVNDAARAVMLAYATGTDLENLAAYFGVIRLVLSPATDTVPAVLESDTDLRARVTLAPELLPHAGMTAGGYRALALGATPALKDVAPLKRDGGRIDLVLLARAGDGSVPAEIVQLVEGVLADDGATQLTDIVTARSARIISYAPTITVLVRPGPDPVLIRTAVDAGVRAYAEDRRRIGLPVFQQMLEAAASVGAVERASADVGDIDPGPDGCTYLTGLTVLVVQP